MCLKTLRALSADQVGNGCANIVVRNHKVLSTTDLRRYFSLILPETAAAFTRTETRQSEAMRQFLIQRRAFQLSDPKESLVGILPNFLDISLQSLLK